ncbi:uncharacterized protein LOC129729493 [Wyeomyia smithii]|uniref:uncharacterized protein LOC129729493 n=1 Tax=Wyeomyia smithii TaxID=174621 RepID=UPI002467C6B2|nr:uncharacterized protein LOC129729493 [Wyeomyia smithii]
MIKVVLYSSLVALVAAQAFVPAGRPPAPFPSPEYFQYPGPIQTPLTPFNVVPDGYYGFNPYQAAFAPAVPPQFAIPNQPIPVNSGASPQTQFINPKVPQVGYPAFLPPQFVPPFPPQQFFPPATANPNQPAIAQRGRPFSDATAVSFTNFQAGQNQTLVGVTHGQGVNGGATRQVSSANNPAGASYGPGFIQYAPATVNPASAGRTLNPAAVPSTPRGFPSSASS